MKQVSMKEVFNYKECIRVFRKEIEECGMLLNLIYEQQNCLMQHNPISLLQATSKIEAQLPINNLATADRTAFVKQLAELNGQKSLALNEIPNYVSIEFKSLFKALVEEIVTLRYRIKSKIQLQQKLLERAQVINNSILQHVLPSTRIYNKKGNASIFPFSNE